MFRMSLAIEAPQLECWFLLDWPCAGAPSVIMEFETRADAERAQRAAFRDTAHAERWALSLTVRSALAMLEQLELREALRAWDQEFAHL